MKTLIIIDVQNDFLPGGQLEVPQSNLIVPVINRIQNCFDLVVATQDWHPKNHKSFASKHLGKRPFDSMVLNGLQQTLWPDHCIQGSEGASFHRDLETDKIAAMRQSLGDGEFYAYGGGETPEMELMSLEYYFLLKKGLIY